MLLLRLSLVAISWGLLFVVVRRLLCWFLLLQIVGFKVCGLQSCSSQALEHRLSDCGEWA